MLSPFWMPVIVPVNAGFGSPYALLAFAAATVSGAGFTVRLALPLEGSVLPSPAKLAVTPPACEPAPIVPRAAVTDATPEAFVTALPAATPFREKLIVFPESGPAVVLSVAERVVLPPYVPLAAATARAVIEGCATVIFTLAELFPALASTAELLLMLTLLVATVPSAIDVLVEATRVTVWLSPLCSR